MTDPLVKLDIQGATALLTLNDPARRNVLSRGMVAAIVAAVDAAEAAEGVVALVVTGAGPGFCAGAELETLTKAAAGDFEAVRAVYPGFLRLLESPLLTIAAVNGPAVGAGMNLALACDVRVASTAARFDCRFTRLRILPGGGHTHMLVNAVGRQWAMRGIVLGEVWDALAAERIGLTTQTFVPADLVAGAIGLTAGLEGAGEEFVSRLLELIRSPAATHLDAFAAESIAQEWSTQQPAFLLGIERVKASIAQDHPTK